jgi:large subunit ribosomal protein L10
VNRDQKAAVVDEVAEAIKSADAVFAVDYRGISVTQAADLRTKLIEADAALRVVKNTLTERAADKAGAEALKELLEGPTALTFVHGDVATAAKAIATFRREHELPSFKGGTMGGDPLTIEQIESIAKLPARDVLNAQLAGTIASPLTGLVRGLNALIAGIAIQLRQIADQGLVSGEAPAAEPEAPAAEQAEPTESEAPAPEAEPEAVAEEAAPAQETADAEEAAEAAEGTPAEPQATPDEQPPVPEAEEAPAAEAEAPAEETPSEAPGDPVAEGEAAEEETSEETPSEGETEEQEG